MLMLLAVSAVAEKVLLGSSISCVELAPPLTLKMAYCVPLVSNTMITPFVMLVKLLSAW